MTHVKTVCLGVAAERAYHVQVRQKIMKEISKSQIGTSWILMLMN